jgi:hypothetical protein
MSIIIGEDKLTVAQQCRHCGKIDTVEVTSEEWDRYKVEHVQVVWPHLTDQEREVLIAERSGGGLYMCQQWWDELNEEEGEW